MSDLNARCCGPGRVWVFGDDINTDLIFPTTAFGLAEQEQPALVFSANRPGWSGQVSEGDFVIAGKNFGTGSGREIGRLLRALGVAGVIAESLNGLGLRNCVAYGMPVLRAPGILRFSQQLSCDHLVLELHEDEHGFDDVADRGRADRNVLNGAPALGHQREAAFALVAHGAQQRVTGLRIDIEFAAARLFHRDVHRCAGAFITGISEDGQFPQVRAGPGQDELAGGGQVMGAARQHVADPQRDPARRGQGLHVPGRLVRLAGVPLIYFPALLAGLLVRAPVGRDERAVQDQVGKSLLNGLLQGLAQGRRLRGEHLGGLVLVPVGGGLRDPGPLAQPADVRPVPEPGEGEDRLLPAGQGTRPVPRAQLAAVSGQQVRHEHRQWQRDVKDDTIGQHAEPPVPEGILVETSCTGGSAFPGDLQLCPRVCPDDCYVVNAGFTVAEKTSLGFVNEGDDIVVDFYAGEISNESQGTEMTGKALPSMLVDMASAGGVLPLLVAEGLVEPEPFGISGPV